MTLRGNPGLFAGVNPAVTIAAHMFRMAAAYVYTIFDPGLFFIVIT
jgi:hypothetical protein